MNKNYSGVERKKVQRDLSASELRVRDLWENAPVAYHMVDTEGTITSVNQTEARMLGYAIKELVGKSVFELIPPEQRTDARNRFLKKIAGQQLPRSANRIFVRKDGTKVHVVDDDRLERDAVGGVVGIWSTLVEIHKPNESEEALRTSEERFRGLVEKSGMAIITDDREGNLIYFNDRYAAIFGYSTEEMRTRTIWSTVHPDEVEKLRIYHAGWLEGRDIPARYELKGVRKDGSIIFLDVETVVLRDGIRPVGTHSYMWDITERKRAEDKRRESDERLRSIAEHSHDGILILDDAFQIIYANSESAGISGYAPEELVGQNFAGFIDDESRELVSELYLRRQRGEKVPPRYEFNIIRKDGKKRRLEISSSVVAGAGGKVETIAQLRDVTEQKKAEEELRASEEKFRILFEYAPDCYYLTDIKGDLIYANKAAEKMFGYKREELIGKSLLDKSIMSSGQIAKAVSLLAKNALGCPTGPEEFALQRKDGSEISVEILAYPVKMNGETMILGIARDVTERRKVKEQLEESYRRLQKSSDTIIQAVSLTIDMRDPYTSDHQRRVAQLAPAIAAEMNFSPDQIESIRVASLIHDMGKFAVPAEILSKPGRLDETELQLIREHPKTGFDILSKIDLPGTIAQIVYQHHERMNGTGYPRGLAGENILPEARVLAVAEALEAMTSYRPYRPALGVDKALQEITQAKGVLFDPEVVEACLRVFVINKFEFK